MVTVAAPDISFLIPAYNAADTLAECIASLQRQTRSNWQAVVIDDGSSDRTWEILQDMAETDSRILPARQPNAGAAAARNHAARLAAAPLLCMLDADDWLDPAYIETMLPAADASLAVIAHCAYRRVGPDGRLMPVEQPPILAGDRARREFSSFCAIAIHTAVFPKSLFERVAGMDETLQTGEEWDLWLRMTFAGAEFRRVDPCLAYYRMKAGSLSGDPMKLVRDAVRVTTKAQALRMQHGVSAEGPETGWITPAFSQLRMLVWAACARLAPAADVATLAALLPEIPDAAGQERFLVDVITHGLRTGLLADRDEDLIDALAQWQPTFLALIRLIERHSLPGTGRKIVETLGWQLTAENPLRSFTLGNLQVVSLELGALARIPKAEQADTLVMHAFSGQQHVGCFVGPFWGDLSIRAQIRLIMQEIKADEHLQAPPTLAYARSWTREALRGYRAFGGLILRSGRRRGRLEKILAGIGRDAILGCAPADGQDNDARLSEILRAAERGLAPPSPRPSGAPPAQGKETPAARSDEDYWEQIFERPDPWNYLSVYEQVKYAQTLSLIPEGTGRALELACAEGIFTDKLAPKVGCLMATDISHRAIERAIARCSGHDNLELRVLDFAKDDLPPDQDLVICSEVLYYMKDEQMLAQVCRKMAAAVKPGGCLITAHAHLRRDEPARTGFDWGHPFGVGTIRQVLAQQAGLALEATIDTELYAIHRFRKGTVTDPVLRIEPHGTPMDVDVAKHVIYGPAGMARETAWTTEVTNSVPILMYHRIAEDGPAALRRFRTPPEIFRKQMQFLRRQGYYAVTAPTLLNLFCSGKPIQGRPVMLTFDDAYLDFRANAFPILAENDLSADVFVVTDKVGGRSDWDCAHGEPAGLMSWPDIQELHQKGISFGSHLASHTPASGMESKALLTEAMSSRNALQSRLGAAADSIALPYGATDFRVPDILALAGYRISFTTRPAVATFADNLFALPRLEVRGDRPLEAFPELIGLPGAFIG